MPAGEVLDYIKLISQAKIEAIETQKMLEASENSTPAKDIAMAGNTLPGGIF